VFELLLTLLQRGRTALHYSSDGGHPEVDEFLVAQGFGVNAVDKVGSLPMSESVFSPIDVAQGGWTPLHWAASSNHVPVIEILVRVGADMGLRNRVSTWGLWNEGYGLELTPRGCRVD